MDGMPEGHVIHRLAHELNKHFQGKAPRVTSPQGRFAAEAALIHTTPLHQAHAWGKHLFLEFDAPTPEHIVHIHLGLIGSLHFDPIDEIKGQIRLRIENDGVAANLRGPQWCRLITTEEMEVAVGKLGADPLRPDSNLSVVRQRVARSRKSIGSLLMDQHLLLGWGISTVQNRSFD